MAARIVNVHLSGNMAGFEFEVKLDCGFHVGTVIIRANHENGRSVLRDGEDGRRFGVALPLGGRNT